MARLPFQITVLDANAFKEYKVAAKFADGKRLAIEPKTISRKRR
jgi:hypothetical protein